MGKKKKMKVSKYELLEVRLGELENAHERQGELVTDLIDYLVRVDPNFNNQAGAFEGWYMRLMQMRNDDEKRKRIARAQRDLEEEGYIVAVDEQSLDAARLKKWVQNPTIINGPKAVDKDDDDIPF